MVAAVSLCEPSTPKERSIHEAVVYSGELFGASLVGVVPVCSDVARQRSWGIAEELVPELAAILTEAQSSALLRVFEQELDENQFRTVLQQIRQSGKELLQFWVVERLRN